MGQLNHKVEIPWDIQSKPPLGLVFASEAKPLSLHNESALHLESIFNSSMLSPKTEHTVRVGKGMQNLCFN